MQKQSAFTLIELLVVIAIIAILAAILFPVFAQAKAAAKATAALSNTKELCLANIMYQNDYDDYFVLGTAWNTGHDPLTFGPGLAFSTWSVSTAPYVKNNDILLDPSGNGDPAFFGLNASAWDTFSPGFGYNYEFLSPIMPSGSTAFPVAQSSTSANAPADTVMLAEKWVHNEGYPSTSTTVWGVGPFPNGMMSDAAAEGVECGSLAQNCFSDWGRGGGYNTPGVIDITSESAGAYTAGNAGRVSGKQTVAFTDGHAKRLGYSQMAVGTNFNYNAANGAVGGNGNISITKASSYLWSLTKDCSQFIYGPCLP